MALRFIDSAAHYDTSTIQRKWTTVQMSVVSSGGRRNAPYLDGLFAIKTLTQTQTWILGAATQSNIDQGLLTVWNNGFQTGHLTANTDATLSVVCFGNTIWTSTLSVSDLASWHFYECLFSFSGTGTQTLTMSGSTWV